MMNIKVKEIRVKSVITKSNIPGIDYVVNPYVGCMHSCVYCYARFMKRFTGHVEPWGKFVDVKINASEAIPASSRKYAGKTLMMSSVTDPYLPLEAKYQLTRRIIERLIPLQPNLLILTKASLVTRDIDLFKQYNRCNVGFSLATLDDDLRKGAEPLASSPAARIEALKTLKRAGIKTYVFIAPIMPFITNWKAIMEETSPYVDYFLIDKLNLKGTIWSSVGSWLEQSRPDMPVKYREIYFKPNNYWACVKKDIDDYCRQHNLSCKIIFGSNQ